MDQDVAKTRQSAPGDLRSLIPDLLGHAFRRFAHYPEAAKDGIRSLWVAQELFSAILGVVENSLRTFEHLDQIQPLVLHNGTASARMRSRMYQWRPLSVTTSTLRPSSS